jgi:MFS family permease
LSEAYIVNIGLSSVGLIMTTALVLLGWALARWMGWSVIVTVTAIVGVVVLLGWLQVWRAVARERRWLREGRWPPDRKQSSRGHRE